MAMIKCRECGKSVSSLAPICPNCGAPISEMSKCTVYFEREKKLAGSAVSAIVYIDGRTVGSAGSGNGFSVRLSPGPHQFSVQNSMTGKLVSINVSIPTYAKTASILICKKESLLNGLYFVFGEISYHK